MANSFKITIDAVDNASTVFKKVNGAVNQLSRPFEQVGQSFKSLGRELGFQRLGKNLGNIGREARGAASGVTSIVAPMAAITGIGSVAGIIALADGWARLGRSTSNTAANIGANAGELQRFQGAARLAGLSTDDMDNSLQGLATTMENAAFGRDNGALLLFNRLGVGIKRTSTGAMDATGELKALATAIGNLKNPQQQMLAAQKFGLSSLLPLIRQGPEALDRLADRAEAMGLVMSGPALKAATDFANSLDNLSGAGTGLKNSVVEQLTPAIKPLVDELAGWIIQNRALIAQDVGGWAHEFATWVNGVNWKGVGEGIHNFVEDIGTVVDHLGGWKGAAITLAVVMNAGLIGSVAALGVSLVRGGVGILSFIGLLSRWSWAAKGAKVASLEAAAAAEAAAVREAAAAGGGALGAGILATGVVAGSLALSGDQDQGERDAQVLQQRALAGDRKAALSLARQQLSHWYQPTPSEKDINQQADEISSGRQAGYTPELMARLHPQQADAEKQLSGLEQKYQLPSGLLDKVWKQESGRGEALLSPKGAKGHFGFMDPTAKQYGLTDPNNFSQSADAAARMYRDLLKSNGGDLDKALAAYNWGQGNLDKKGLAQAPAETRNYIQSIEGGMKADRIQAQPPAPVAADQVAPQGPVSAAKNEPQRHAFDVTFSGLPPGVTAKVKSPTGAEVNSKIGYSAIGSVA
jgi:soluble lytic murein transglycosylase-like protein